MRSLRKSLHCKKANGEAAILSTNTRNTSLIEIRQLGLMPYSEALHLQDVTCIDREKKIIPDTLLLLEHPPTYTIGLRGAVENFRVPVDSLRQKGMEVFQVDRGGDVTFHGPGQLVGYPIIDISARKNDIRQYVCLIEEVIIATLKEFGITAGPLPGYPGVWVEDKKIAAIGIKINFAGITSHGFAVSVNTDLACFKNIVPCGLEHKSVTSMAEILNVPVSVGQVRAVLSGMFAQIFG